MSHFRAPPAFREHRRRTEHDRCACHGDQTNQIQLGVRSQHQQCDTRCTDDARDDLDSMLLNVVNPSAQIREGFENFVVQTDDGRQLNGFLIDQDSQVVVLRGADGQTTVVPRADIEELRPAGVSLMPEQVLKPLSDDQVRDLFAYLRSTQPLAE